MKTKLDRTVRSGETGRDDAGEDDTVEGAGVADAEVRRRSQAPRSSTAQPLTADDGGSPAQGSFDACAERDSVGGQKGLSGSIGSCDGSMFLPIGASDQYLQEGAFVHPSSAPNARAAPAANATGVALRKIDVMPLAPAAARMWLVLTTI